MDKYLFAERIRKARKEAGYSSQERFATEYNRRFRQEQIEKSREHTDNVFGFMERTFGDDQEMVLFLTMTGRDVYAKEYLSDVGSEAYARHSKLLLLREQKAQLGQEVRLALS